MASEAREREGGEEREERGRKCVRGDGCKELAEIQRESGL